MRDVETPLRVTRGLYTLSLVSRQAGVQGFKGLALANPLVKSLRLHRFLSERSEEKPRVKQMSLRQRENAACDGGDLRL